MIAKAKPQRKKAEPKTAQTSGCVQWRYRDPLGRELFVADGISRGSLWSTYHRSESGTLHRLKSKNLPERTDREQAQADLDRYAAKSRLAAIGGSLGDRQRPAPPETQAEKAKPLTKGEANDLKRLEGRVREGLMDFVEVGHALAEIRDRRLYRAEYESFEAYLADRWSLGRPAGYRLIDSAAVVARLKEDCGPAALLPANEAQARELVPVLRDDPRYLQEAWEACIDSAHHTDDGDPVLTAAHIRNTVHRYVTPADELDREDFGDVDAAAVAKEVRSELAGLGALIAKCLSAGVENGRRKAIADYLRELAKKIAKE